MDNQTTPLKGAFISLVTGSLMAHFGFNPLDAGAVATGAWIVVSAAVAYLIPVNLGQALSDRLGLRP